jgi:hypothetical protein
MTDHISKPIRKRPLRDHRPSFDVTCTIGTVYLDGNGEHTPMEAAMLLIAQHGAPGVFRFPNEQGGFINVDLTHDLEI